MSKLRRTSSGCTLLAATLFALAPVKANALTVLVHMLPKDLNTQVYGFRFSSSRNDDGTRHVAFKVSEKKTPLSSGLLASLHLKSGPKEVANIPLELSWDRGIATYRFDVSPDLAPGAEFEFDVLSGEQESDGHGHQVFIGVPGRVEYLFHLADFVGK